MMVVVMMTADFNQQNLCHPVSSSIGNSLDFLRQKQSLEGGLAKGLRPLSASALNKGNPRLPEEETFHPVCL